MKKIVLGFFIVLLLCAGGFFAYLYLNPVEEQDLFNFVPEDAMFFVESNDPIQDWRKFSQSAVWQHLKTNAAFEDIHGSADYLDSLITENKSLLKLEGRRKTVISAHMTGKKDYDFLILLDLKKGAKVTFMKDIALDALKDSGIKLERRKLKGGTEVLQIFTDEGDPLLVSFVDNILLVSFSSKIMLSALDQQNEPFWSRKSRFLKLKKSVDTNGPYQIYLNYPLLKGMASLYMDDPEDVHAYLDMLQYSGLDFQIDDELAGLAGYTTITDSIYSVIKVMNEVEGSKLRAPEVLPLNTSFFASINFDDFDSFYKQITVEMQKDSLAYLEFEKNMSKLEKFLSGSGKKNKFSIQEHLFSWIGQEITIGMVPKDSLGREQAYLALFHTKDPEDAKTNLGFLAERLKKKPLSPVKFQTNEYRGYEVSTTEIKSFFKLLLGKMVDKFDKPHFTIVDDFVVFSNDTVSLHRLIDGYEDKQTLDRDDEFDDFIDNFSTQSSVFAYSNQLLIYPFLLEQTAPADRAAFKKNKEYLFSFPYAAFQLKESNERYKTQVYFEYIPYSESVVQ